MPNNAIHLTEWHCAGQSDPVVVMVHGGAQGTAMGGERHFAAQSRLGVRGWHVVVPDRPGHGRSPSRGVPDDPQIDGKWVSELLGSGAHLVGHSFGGAVALAAAVMRPDAVLSLTLVEPAMQALTIHNPHTQAFISQIGAAMMSATPAEVAAGFTKVAGIPEFIWGERTPQAMEQLGTALRALKLPTEQALRDGLATIKTASIPFLTISGGWNPSIDATCEKAAELGGGRKVTIKSEHHFPQIVSDEFNDLLEAHMIVGEKRRKTS